MGLQVWNYVSVTLDVHMEEQKNKNMHGAKIICSMVDDTCEKKNYYLMCHDPF